MGRSIKIEYEKAKPYGREFVKRMAVERFQLSTGKLRMNDTKAGELFEIVYPEYCREELIS